MKPTNDKRVEALKGYTDSEPLGGYVSFNKVPVSLLKELVKAKLLDPEETQNYSPSTREFIELMDKHEGLLAHGYIITEGRSDARITIEGVEGLITAESMPEVVEILRHADEFSIHVDYWDSERDGKKTQVYGYRVRSWWD